MKTTYFDKKQEFNLSVDYGKMMGSGWVRRLKDYLQSEEMREVMFSVKKMYDNTDMTILPAKKDIFKIFNKLDVTEIDVVIINCNPIFNYRSNGIAFSNDQNDDNSYDIHLINLFNKISNYDQRKLFKEDYTLEHWLEQFVFPLNVSLTGFATSSQRLQWFGFIKTVLQIISKSRQGIIFLFVGEEHQCRQYIDLVDHKKHTVLRHNSLSYDALNDINLNIDVANGKDYRIRW